MFKHDVKHNSFFFFLLGCFIYIIVNHEVESRKPQPI